MPRPTHRSDAVVPPSPSRWHPHPWPSLSHLAVVIGLLVAATLWVYAPVGEFGFVNWDDPAYVEDNPPVREGLTMDGVVWALTTGHASNWHPLTWLSLMLDVELFGVDAGAMHRVNVALHVGAAVLLLLLLLRLTGRLGASAAVAALFALHPLHVESVAWIAERKDVLSGLLWWAATLAWVGYVAKPSRKRYGWVLLLFAAGLAAKPMLVTWPFTLLLLDIWPLRRAGSTFAELRSPVLWRPLVWEKVPFFALAAVSSAVTFWVQRAGGAVSTLEHVPLVARLANAVVAYGAYLTKTLWPRDLALLYPHPGFPPPLATLGSALLLLALTVLLFWWPLRQRGAVRWMWAPVGWLFFLGTLVPVIGVVQVGAQAYADRYTYLPLTGIFWIVTWAVDERLRSRPIAWRRAAVGAGGVALVVLSLQARAQVETWRDSETLFRHALAVTDDNHRIHNVLGVTLLGQGRLEEAQGELERAVEIKPGFADAWNNLGVTHSRAERPAAAQEAFRRAVALDPSDVEARSNLGNALAQLGRPREALAAYGAALEIDGDDASARRNLALTLVELGRLEAAATQLEELLRRHPGDAVAHGDLGNVAASQGDLDAAVEHYRQALQLDPLRRSVRSNLAQVLARGGRLDEAVSVYRQLLEADPEDGPSRLLLALVELVRGNRSAAEAEVGRLRSSHPELAAVLVQRLNEGIEEP